MDNKILLVVDVQEIMMVDQPFNKENVIDNIKKLLSAARDTGTEVAYVRHDGGKGSDMEAGTDGWQIYHEIAPVEGERIFDKRFNSAFVKTDLKEYLESRQVTTIILTGMQTEYCIDATCKSAFEHGFQVIVPEETNTTYDNDFLSGEKLYQFFNYTIWNNRFAKVIPMKDALEDIKNQ